MMASLPGKRLSTAPIWKCRAEQSSGVACRRQILWPPELILVPISGSDSVDSLPTGSDCYLKLVSEIFRTRLRNSDNTEQKYSTFAYAEYPIHQKDGWKVDGE